MILWILLILVILICIALSKTPQARGRRGEKTVRFCIGGTNEPNKYVINDLRLRTEDGKTSQIDHVVILPAGVFVIETKNYSGRIYGNANQLEWTQVLNFGKEKHRFYNPIKQNNTHLYRIGQILGKSVPLHSAIVFVQGNTENIKADNVFDLRGLKRLLSESKQTVLSAEQMKDIYTALIREKENAHLSTSEHVAGIKQMQSNIQSNICPRCGGKLLERRHGNNRFLGCTNYPNCRFTKNL